MPSPRRRFLETLAGALLLPAALVGPQTAPPSPAPTGVDGMAEALTDVVKGRYSGLEEADLEEIKKGIVSNLRNADRLRAARKLGNGDEPVTVFEARPRSPRPKGRARR